MLYTVFMKKKNKKKMGFNYGGYCPNLYSDSDPTWQLTPTWRGGSTSASYTYDKDKECYNKDDASEE